MVKLPFAIVALQQNETFELNEKNGEIEKESLKISSPNMRQAVFCLQKPV
jgi:hypothetical protein